MTSFRHFRFALGVCVASAMASSAIAAAHDFGDVSTFATTSEAVTGGAMYTKLLTFSLNSAADVRIDMRAIGYGYKYDAGTFRLASPVFSLFDSNHARLAYSIPDTGFSQTDGNDCTFTPCTFNQGLTLSQSLAAGSYSIEFASYVLGTRQSTVHFGVSKNEASVISAYLTQVTPAGAVPEASTCAMMLLGLAGLGLGVRKQRV